MKEKTLSLEDKKVMRILEDWVLFKSNLVCESCLIKIIKVINMKIGKK